MKFTVITLFPDMITDYMNQSMMWKGQKDDLIELNVINLRDFGLGERKTVDDAPYGGGDGMLLKPEPAVGAIEAAHEQAQGKTLVAMMSPRGERFDQSKAKTYSTSFDEIIFVCGRYEGFDERIRDYVDVEVSIGDYVLTGGELPALTVIDATARLIPGVLGGENSAEIESFSDGKTLEYPQYTRPEEFRGVKVPDVLLSGHHAKIAAWREQQAQTRTDKQ
jgi:tRNA (guanine37-N1)-methyltransferase